MNIKNNAGLVQPVIVPKEDGFKIALLTRSDRLLVIEADEVPRLPRGRGVKLIGITKPQEGLKQAAIIGEGQDLGVVYKAQEPPHILSIKEITKHSANRGTKGRPLKTKGALYLEIIDRNDTEPKTETEDS